MTRTLRFVCCFLLLALASASALAQNGIITTIAGGAPNNIPAISAGIGYPYPVAADAAGNFYFATNSPNYAVFKVDTSGTLTRFAGSGTNGFSGDGGPAAAAQIGCVYGLALDSFENLYLADLCNNRVRMVEASTGIITTVAGNGSYAYSGDGGPAASASLTNPYSVAVDPGGNIFIADTNNYRIRRVDAGTGNISTVAGNGSFGNGTDGVTATSTNLGYVYGLTVDGAGNVYFSDVSNSIISYSYVNYYRVRRIDASSQIVTTVAGGLGDANYCSLPLGDGGSATSAGLCYPYDLTFDSAHNLYISDSGHYRIRKVDASGTITTFAGNGSYGFSGDGGPAANASLSQPWGIAADGTGNLYIADLDNVRVRRVDSLGNISTVAGNGLYNQLSNPYSPVMDSSGNLFIADEGNRLIRRVDATSGLMSNYAGTGNYGYSADGTVATAANLGCAVAVALDSAQNVYLADPCNQVVQKIDRTSGLISTVAGVAFNSGYNGDGNPAASSYLTCPYGIAFDSSDNLYIADACNQRIRKVDHFSGLISTVAGNGTYGFSGDGGLATSANLSYPYGITVDGSNNLFIADEGNQRVRRVDATTGVITTIAGGGSDYTTNGIPATGAALQCAVSLASDSAGDVFISDYCAGDIRKVDSSGNINTVAGTVFSHGFSGDGGPATSAILAYPWGISLSAAGDLYIADIGNQRIRRVKGVTASSNQPPIAKAGQNQTFEATSAAGANVPLDGSGSSDPDGDTLTYTWTGPFGTATGIKPIVVLPLGTNIVALKVDDGHGNTATATVQITVIDTTPPVLTLPANITAQATNASGAVVTFTASANDTVAGILPVTCTPPSRNTFPIGVSRVTCTAVDEAGNASSGSFLVTVSQTTQTITFPALPNQTYGNADFAVGATASSGLALSFTVGATDNCTISGSTIHITGAGNCTVTAHQPGNATYSAAADVPQNFTIGQASSITAVACGAGPFTYNGSAQTPCTATVTGAGGLSQSLTVSYTNNTNAGTATANASFTGDANHTGSSSSANFTITRKAASVTPAAASKIYGAADPAFTGALSGFVATDGVTATYNRAAGETVAGSPYAISATLSPAGVLGNYNVTYNTASFTITKATLTVTANSTTKILDAPNPALNNATYSGFKFSDGPTSLGGTLSCTTTAGTTSPVGSYPITCSGLTAPNYTTAYVPGTLKILYAPAGTACAGDVSKTILQPVNADGTSVWKAGRTVPVKFKVCDANGVSIGTPGVVSSFMLTGIWNGTLDPVDETVAATNVDTAFRWDGTLWIFNLSTSGLSAGNTYIYTIALNDGTIVTGTTLAGSGNASFQYGLR